MKTTELTGAALDWAVALAEGTLGVKPGSCSTCKHHEERSGMDGALYYCHHPESRHETDIGWGDAISPAYGVHPSCPITALTPEPYSTNWSLAGPIIERENISLERPVRRRGCAVIGFHDWRASHPKNYVGLIRYRGDGRTALVAAMRCYVASKLGDEVEIPEGLR